MEKLIRSLYDKQIDLHAQQIDSKFLKNTNSGRRTVLDFMRNICISESHTLIFGCNRDTNSLAATKFVPKLLFTEQSVSFGRKQIIPHRILMTGRRCIGKTSFCNYLAMEWSKGNLWALPDDSSFHWLFKISSEDLTNALTVHGEGLQIPHILFEAIFEKAGCDFKSVVKLWENIIGESSREKVLFVLDGYTFNAAIDDLLNNTLVANQNCSVLTFSDEIDLNDCESRFLLNQDLVLENVEFILCDLTAASQLYFQSEQSKQFDQWILRSKFQEVAFYPLNLDLLCNFWEETVSALPNNENVSALEEDYVMSDIFCTLLRKLMEIFLFQYNGKDPKAALEAMETIAFHSYRSVLSEMKVVELSSVLREEMVRAVVEFLKSVGLIVPCGKSDYAFVYLQFQEYLIGGHFAREFLQMGDVPITEKDIVKHDKLYFIAWNKFNPMYQAIWVYLSGILYNPDKYMNCYEVSFKIDFLKTVGTQTKVPVHLQALDKYFTLLLLPPRDLYGVYELRLLIRCGEEAKWPEHYAVTNNLLNYLGTWIMKIAGMKKRVKALTEYKVHVLLPDHLSKLFIACPNVMFKVKYRSRVGLYDILIYQAHIPGWIQWFVDVIDNICQLNGFKDFVSWIIDVIIVPLGEAWQKYVGINLFAPISKLFLNKDNDLESEKRRFYEEYENNWRGIVAYTMDSIADWFVQLPIMVKIILAIVMFPTGLGVGFGLLGVYLVFFYVFVVFPLVLFGFVTFFIPMGYAFFGYAYYLQRVETMKTFLSKFQYRDIHSMHQLIRNLLKNSSTDEDYDYDNQVRLIDSLEKKSFSIEVLPDLLSALHALMITSEDWPIQKHAFLKYKLLLPLPNRIYEEDEAILLFNHTMFHACFEEGLDGNRIGSRRLNLVKTFLAQVFSNQIVRIVFKVIDSDLPNIQELREWYQGKSKEEQYFVRSHFCFLYYCLLLPVKKTTSQKTITEYVKRWLLAIIKWQCSVITKQIEVRQCYEDMIRRQMNQSIASITSAQSEVELFSEKVTLYNPKFYKPKEKSKDDDDDDRNDSDIEMSKDQQKMQKTLDTLLHEVHNEKNETKRISEDLEEGYEGNVDTSRSQNHPINTQHRQEGNRQSVDSVRTSGSTGSSRISKMFIRQSFEDIIVDDIQKETTIFGSFSLKRSFSIRLKESNSTRDDDDDVYNYEDKDERAPSLQLETFDANRKFNNSPPLTINETATITTIVEEKTMKRLQNKQERPLLPFDNNNTTIAEFIFAITKLKNVHTLLIWLEKLRRRNNHFTVKECQQLYPVLLQKAYDLAWYRDIIVVGGSIVIIYLPLVMYAFIQSTAIAVLLCIVLFIGEILFAQVAPWDDRGFNKGLALRCVASTAYFCLLCWIATFWVLIGVSMFVTCFGIERIIQSFDYMIVTIFHETIATSKAIDKIEQILSKANYALPYVSDYSRNSYTFGIIGRFNSSYSYQDILHGFLVNNNFGAIYLQSYNSSSSSQRSDRLSSKKEGKQEQERDAFGPVFHWYHGLEKQEFVCKNTFRLLKDIRNIRPLSTDEFLSKWTLRYFVNNYFPSLFEENINNNNMNTIITTNNALRPGSSSKEIFFHHKDYKKQINKNILQNYWEKSCAFLQNCDILSLSLLAMERNTGRSLDFTMNNPLHQLDNQHNGTKV